MPRTRGADVSGYQFEVRSGGRKYEVTPGADRDLCQHCGILRYLAGYTAASCGDDFRREGCFVAPAPAPEEPT